MRKIILISLIATTCLRGQTSNYPSSLDTDASLFVTADNVQSSLSVAMTAGDNVAIVASGTGFAADMIATICDSTDKNGKCTSFEHMLITSVAGQALTVQRGFDGTTAKSHAAGKLVSISIDSAHQKALKNAVVKIETALGPNLSNVAPTAVPVQQYDFSAQQPGTSLSAGTCSFVMTPLPPGVVAGDKLYLSGGTGTAEVLVVSSVVGSTVSGTCAGPHSGSWTVQSATHGILEAWLTKGGGSTYFLPPGAIDLYADPAISVASGQSVIFQGSSYGTVGYLESISGGTTLVQHASGNAFSLTGLQGLYSGELSLRDLRIQGNAGTLNVLYCNLCQSLELINVTLEGAGVTNGNGLACLGCFVMVSRRSLFVNNNGTGMVLLQAGTGGGAYVLDGDRFIDNCQNSGGAACANAFINGAYAVEVSGTSFEGANSITSAGGSALDGGFGLRLQNVFGFSIHGSYAERNRSGSVGIFLSRGFDISGNTFLDSGLYVDSTAQNGTIHGNAFEAADTVAMNVSNVVSNGGVCQITTATAHGLAVYATVYLTGIGGAACNGPALVTSVQSATTYTTNRPFSGVYTSGGTSQAQPGIVVTPNTDVRVYGNDIYDSPGPAAFYLMGADLLHGLGTAIASATTITPTYEVHHITGTTAIVNITPPTTFASGFQGEFCAIPDGAFTTTTGGNIAVASTAVVGKRLCWTYDPTTAKWYPSY